MSELPHSTPPAESRARDLGPHPVRSLAFSTLCHALLAIVLMLIPISALHIGMRRRSSSHAVITFTVPTPVSVAEWDDSAEELEEVAALDPAVELPEDFVEPEAPRDTFFDDPLVEEGRREVPLPAAAAFEELPDDLFEDAQVAPEPVETEILEPEPAPPEPEVAPEPPPDETPPPEVDDASDVNSEESPETEGPAEEAESSGSGFDRSWLLEAPAPRYPASARAQGKQGTVVLAIDVDAAGKVVQVRIKTSSGHQVL
ncbi:MAG: TonB family protein, partial [Planctomycetes bacterium]|nr:TonB family protein [Planctomycetota bacterium]